MSVSFLQITSAVPPLNNGAAQRLQYQLVKSFVHQREIKQQQFLQEWQNDVAHLHTALQQQQSSLLPTPQPFFYRDSKLDDLTLTGLYSDVREPVSVRLLTDKDLLSIPLDQWEKPFHLNRTPDIHVRKKLKNKKLRWNQVSSVITPQLPVQQNQILRPPPAPFLSLPPTLELKNAVCLNSDAPDSSKPTRKRKVKCSATFECPFKGCGEKFTRKEGVKNHLKHRHSKDKTFGCSVCGKLFATKKGLKAHLNTHKSIDQRKTWTCSNCHHPYLSERNYAQHECHSKELPIDQLPRALRSLVDNSASSTSTCASSSSNPNNGDWEERSMPIVPSSPFSPPPSLSGDFQELPQALND